ncbi:EAL domain-containing protein [Catenovulum sp. SM1970]|uniref:EAL domain-containing protein n=1 Tax=Marinifaba aquimaris TaxID=2741323 RepID=UPI00157185C0|nr:EAL domain-containing protein [Marinifaba aquimaris]NTS78450.1 EAL domain-containing protein [Marinifaba aquimaris]
MSIFRRLLVRNLITFLILVFSFMFTFCLIVSDHINEKQNQHSQILKRIIDSYQIVDAKVLAKNLKASFDYSQLTIKDGQGASLYSYQDDGASSSLGHTLLSNLSYLPEEKMVRSKKHELAITYQLRFKQELNLFDSTFYSSLLITLVVLILLSISIRQLIQHIVRRSVANISNMLNNLSKEEDSDAVIQSLPEEFLPLTESLEQLQSNFEKKLSVTRATADSYKVNATRDELTGLKNRISFVEYFEERLQNIDNLDFGTLAVTRATELNAINQNRGYSAGDEYITELANTIQRVVNTYQNAEVYRLNGSDFAVLLPSVTAKEAENFAINLQGRLGELQQNIETDSIAYTGLVAYEAGRPLGELLALTDTAVCIAQTKYANAWHIQTDISVLENVSAKYGNQNWREVIEQVIDNKKVVLYYQPIQPTNKNSKVYSEVLARFTNEDDQVLPTASFIAMAEKMDKIIFVDKLIVEQTMNLIQERGLQSQYFGINITSKSAHDEQFAIWLERRLLRDPAIASKIVFEVTEFGMQQNMSASKRFLDMVHRTGARVTVERFGMGMTSFKFFRDLKPDFIKMDGSYSRGVDEDKNNQYFLRVIVDLAHRLGVNVIAESVETQEEKHALEQLFVDGTQGYFIGKPVEF